MTTSWSARFQHDVGRLDWMMLLLMLVRSTLWVRSINLFHSVVYTGDVVTTILFLRNESNAKQIIFRVSMNPFGMLNRLSFESTEQIEQKLCGFLFWFLWEGIVYRCICRLTKESIEDYLLSVYLPFALYRHADGQLAANPWMIRYKNVCISPLRTLRIRVSCTSRKIADRFGRVC